MAAAVAWMTTAVATTGAIATVAATAPSTAAAMVTAMLDVEKPWNCQVVQENFHL